MNTNQLYYGDNLDILRNHIPDESVDLIYIDPPFNSNQAYNVIFSETDGSSSQAQIRAFEDTWRWGEATEGAYHELVGTAPHLLVETIKSFRGFLTETNLMAYLVMMALRLVELHRALKPTGSFYLHCDPTASHYLKIILDQIFGVENFRNEIVWERTNAHNMKARYYSKVHDLLLFYSKTDSYTWNKQYTEYSDAQLSRYKTDEDGRLYTGRDLTMSTAMESRNFEWRGTRPPAHRSWGASLDQLEEWYAAGRILLKKDGTPRLDGLKVYLDELPGKQIPSIWNDISRIGNTSKERLGYPTQKPLALLERIIKTSSNEGEVVLDTFAGCGTTIEAAATLNRQWIGIDITHLAITLLKYRLADAFDDDVKYEIIGEPKDAESARALAIQDRYQFQWWALSLIRARPYQGKKKGADEGVDGVIYYEDVDPDKPRKTLTQKIVVQVKSGKVSVKDIRELKSVVEAQDAVIGVFITLNPPTRPMVREAATAGRFQWLHVAHTTYPKIQIRTIDELLAGHGIEYPQMPVDVTFRRAERAAPQSQQIEIEA
jgi:site-specific DNA-methyltransferase (adenine-specific)